MSSTKNESKAGLTEVAAERKDMSIEIRALTSDDKHRHSELMEHAFGRGRVVTPPAPDAPPTEISGVWGLFENSSLRAAVSVVPYQVHWGADTVLAMGGIGGVATFAEARGRGFVEQLLRQSLVAMRDSGQVVSSLFPFSWSFYRKQGWDWVGERRSVKLPLSEVKSHHEGRKVVCLTGKETRSRLEDSYTTYAKRYNGMCVTGSHDWSGKLAHHDNRTTYIYLYEPTGEYFCWRYDGNGDQGECHDFVAYTPDGHRALLSILHYLGTQVRGARLNLPANSPVWSHVYHWNLNTEIAPVFMGRVVDFAAALTKLTLPADTPNGSATLHLTDEQAPWNAGVWRITVEDGKLTCDAVIGGTGEADVAADIQAISQAFWGTPTLAWLRDAGRVQVINEPAFLWLRQVLVERPVFILDSF